MDVTNPETSKRKQTINVDKYKLCTITTGAGMETTVTVIATDMSKNENIDVVR